MDLMDLIILKHIKDVAADVAHLPPSISSLLVDALTVAARKYTFIPVIASMASIPHHDISYTHNVRPVVLRKVSTQQYRTNS